MTTLKPISTGEALYTGWRTFKKNWGFWILATVLVNAIPAIPLLLAELTDNGIINLLLVIVAVVLSLLVSIGMIKLTLEALDGRVLAYAELFRHGRYMINLIIGSILYTLILVVGLVLLVIPGIIWGIMFSQFFFLIVDKDLGPIESLKASAKITKGARWDLLALVIVSTLVLHLGFIALGIGIFVAAPLVNIAYAFVYRKLAKSTILQK